MKKEDKSFAKDSDKNTLIAETEQVNLLVLC